VLLYSNIIILQTLGSFNRITTLTQSTIEDLLKLLHSSEFTKKIQPNGFSKY